MDQRSTFLCGRQTADLRRRHALRVQSRRPSPRRLGRRSAARRWRSGAAGPPRGRRRSLDRRRTNRDCVDVECESRSPRPRPSPTPRRRRRPRSDRASPSRPARRPAAPRAPRSAPPRSRAPRPAERPRRGHAEVERQSRWPGCASPRAPAALVSTSASPGRPPAAVTMRSRRALPTPLMTTSGAVMPGATSVWPPSTSTFSCARSGVDLVHDPRDCRRQRRQLETAALPARRPARRPSPPGRCTPRAPPADPRPSVAVVIGSVVSTQAQSRVQRRWPRRRRRAPRGTSVSGRRAPSRPSTSPRSSSGGSLPVPESSAPVGSDAKQRVRSLEQLRHAGQEGRGRRAVHDAMVEAQRQRAHRARLRCCRRPRRPCRRCGPRPGWPSRAD